MSNDRETLDEQIRQMAEELDAWPSVAPRVMREVCRRVWERVSCAVAKARPDICTW